MAANWRRKAAQKRLAELKLAYTTLRLCVDTLHIKNITFVVLKNVVLKMLTFHSNMLFCFYNIFHSRCNQS